MFVRRIAIYVYDSCSIKKVRMVARQISERSDVRTIQRDNEIVAILARLEGDVRRGPFAAFWYGLNFQFVVANIVKQFGERNARDVE